MKYQIKDVNGFEGYRIDTDGVLWSGRKKNRETGKYKKIKGSFGLYGYKIYILKTLDGKNKVISARRLVAEHFIPNPENKRFIICIDGDLSNSEVSNLGWSNKTRAYKMVYSPIYCRDCGKKFLRQSSYSAKYCSCKCKGAVYKQIYSGKNANNYQHGMYAYGKKPEDTKEYRENANSLKDKMLSESGYIYCQYCGINRSPIWDTHHIVFRSEAPKHKNLHKIDNLIVCCRNCHNSFHKKKTTRATLIKERGLDKLFPELHLINT